MSGLTAQKWDLIQVSPDHGKEWARGRVLIVEEPKSFGCVAYVDLKAGRAYARLHAHEYKPVGRLAWIPGEPS